MKQKCTRCGDELIPGKNIYVDWHIPICKSCRKQVLDSEKVLTKEEKEITNKRFGKEVFK